MIAPDRGDPEVSVVMVSYGAWPLAQRAIAALIDNTPAPFELIVVDNGSDAPTREELLALADARVILNEGNVGFGPAANQGARFARAPCLLFLNTDAFVHPGWLGPLWAALELDGVAAAVPCLLHEDGTLQDAGTLVARDGTVRVYGDGDDAARPRYRFRRFLDVGSGACMLTRRAAFEELGGFDVAFAPAYYEDADFCLRLADQSLAVVYEPASRVTHVRYGSGGRANAAELSERNRHLFAARWHASLRGRPPTFDSASEQAINLSRDAGARPRILICAARADRAAPMLAHALLEHWPTARLTWALAGRHDGLPESNPWIELVDESDAAWLHERLFHYDLVVLGDEPGRRLNDALRTTQPQAARAALGDLAGLAAADLGATLSRAGIAPATAA